eukprot:COSAG02_NODE_15592_length_1157_cov_2.225898_1_plen_123_part_00
MRAESSIGSSSSSDDKSFQEPKPTSKCNINIAAVELCLRDHGQHTEKQIVQLCKIAAELQTKPTNVTNVCLRFEGTLRSFGRCREDDIGTLLALIKPEPSATGTGTTSTVRTVRYQYRYGTT